MIKAIKAVYSYYLPEVREIISKLVRDYPHDVFLRSVSPGLDDFHAPIIAKFTDFFSGSVPALKDFESRYPTSGSEEFIREYITGLKADRIYVLKGEYEGYKEIAKTRGVRTVEVDEDADPSSLEPGPWFLSNPSARNGDFLPDALVSAICEAGHEVFYDLAYLGSTRPKTLDLSHPNIAAVATSFSKTFGLFYYRVGFGFSRRPLPALYANKWFKNVFSLLVAEKIMDTLGPQDIPERYKPVQERIVSEINSRHGLRLRPSDAFLIATLGSAEGLSEEKLELVRGFRRGPAYRFCLTPYFQELEGS